MNIAIVSLGSGGTMGHMSLTTSLSSEISRKNKVFLFSDHDYSDFSNVKKPNFKFVKIPSQKHQKSVGGKINYLHKEDLFLKLEKNKIQTLIFSTFYDLEILNHCKKNKIKTILVSYPLRDSHREIVRLRKYYSFFDKVFTLNDLHNPNKISNKEFFVSPIISKNKPGKKTDEIREVLITCGGGGRPSAEVFFKITLDAVKKISKKYPNVKFNLIKGNSNVNSKSKNMKIIKWSKDFHRLLSKQDLIISEAGYYTLLDLITFNKPAIIIPGERRIDNQELRAVKFQEKGLGWVIFPTEKSADLSDLVEHLIKNPNNLNNKNKFFDKVKKEILSGDSLDKKIIKEIQ
jgi:UDP-N-acetylglucosamine:LPS N-acetylglucosamine transferase